MVVYLKEDTKFASEKFICQPIYLGPLCIEPIKWNETDSHKSKEHMPFVFILTWSQQVLFYYQINFLPLVMVYVVLNRISSCQGICESFCHFMLCLVAFPSWTFCFV